MSEKELFEVASFRLYLEPINRNSGREQGVSLTGMHVPSASCLDEFARGAHVCSQLQVALRVTRFCTGRIMCTGGGTYGEDSRRQRLDPENRGWVGYGSIINWNNRGKHGYSSVYEFH